MPRVLAVESEAVLAKLEAPKGEGRVTFSFDERKAAAATALVLDMAKGQMPYLLLLKILYHADRESIEKYGAPIIGDRYVSMDWGPVLSAVYDRFKDIAKLQLTPRGWESVGRVNNVTLSLQGKPDLGPLSEAETDVLRNVYERLGKKDRFVVAQESHELGEYEQPPEGSAKDIDPETILRVLGKGEEEIEAIAERAEKKAFFEKLFGS